ncbi:hypothetical protein VPH35_130846 [Triticum aestivum]
MAAARRAVAAAVAASPLRRAAASVCTRPLVQLCHSVSSYTTRRPLCDGAPVQIPPKIRREITRVELAGISFHRDLAKELRQLSMRVTRGQGAARVSTAMQVGVVSWRVCTAVVAVMVAAGLGLAQVAKDRWEADCQLAACNLVTAKLDKLGKDLEDCLVRCIQQKKATADANAFLEEQRHKDVLAREAELALWESEIIKRESK